MPEWRWEYGLKVMHLADEVLGFDTFCERMESVNIKIGPGRSAVL